MTDKFNNKFLHAWYMKQVLKVKQTYLSMSFNNKRNKGFHLKDIITFCNGNDVLKVNKLSDRGQENLQPGRSKIAHPNDHKTYSRNTWTHSSQELVCLWDISMDAGLWCRISEEDPVQHNTIVILLTLNTELNGQRTLVLFCTPSHRKSDLIKLYVL